MKQNSVRDSEDDTAQKTAPEKESGQASNSMVKEIVRDSLPIGSSSVGPPPHMRAWKVGTNTQSAATAPTVKKSLRDSRVDFLETAKFQKVQMAPLRRRAVDVVRVTSSCRLDPKVVRLTSLEPEERGVGCTPYLGPTLTEQTKRRYMSWMPSYAEAC